MRTPWGERSSGLVASRGLVFSQAGLRGLCGALKKLRGGGTFAHMQLLPRMIRRLWLEWYLITLAHPKECSDIQFEGAYALTDNRAWEREKIYAALTPMPVLSRYAHANVQNLRRKPSNRDCALEKGWQALEQMCDLGHLLNKNADFFSPDVTHEIFVLRQPAQTSLIVSLYRGLEG